MAPRNLFQSVHTTGHLFSQDLLERLSAGDTSIQGLKAQDYHLDPSDRLKDAAARAWSKLNTAYKSYRDAKAKLPDSDIGTTLTRERWLLPLFSELGYGRLPTQKAIDIDGKSYPISHCWNNCIPIHLVTFRHETDKRVPGMAGAASRSPYSIVQELLNRSESHRWGFVSNGRMLYLLRDNKALARAANVEFDLEAIFENDQFADFILLYILCHQSRVEPRNPDTPEECWLEDWCKVAESSGTRARDHLRDGVQKAMEHLGQGFLASPYNKNLSSSLKSGALSPEGFYHQILRLVYRLLLLLVAENRRAENGRNLLHPIDADPKAIDRYNTYYSISRLRDLATSVRGTDHDDLYESLKLLFVQLGTGYAPLAIPAMGSFLFSAKSTATPDLDTANLPNRKLLAAILSLSRTEDTSVKGGAIRRSVDFANLGSEELGSVYESLLELTPRLFTPDGLFVLRAASGNERKSTGSYYTPRSLINSLLDTALEPVISNAIDKLPNDKAEIALLNLKVCDPACGSGHFLLAAGDRLAMRLAKIRTSDEEPSTLAFQHARRDVIGKCLYGVDLNPMAVELCKVSLWMDALEPGKPLSFLDHHIQHGNSLIGCTPALLSKGIPDEAFAAIEGDVKAIVSTLKKQNKKERGEHKAGQGILDFFKLGNLSEFAARLHSISHDTLQDEVEAESMYTTMLQNANYKNARFVADAWCSAFVWKKEDSELGQFCPTEQQWRKWEKNPHVAPLQVRDEVARLSSQYKFFHWHLVFPEVFIAQVDGKEGNSISGWKGGFDAILANPPWERVKLQEKEWFAQRNPDIANAPNAAARTRMINALSKEDPKLFSAFQDDLRKATGESHLLRSSNLFPLCGRGDINVYTVFAELMRTVVNEQGRVGAVLPSGIASDDTTKFFFQDLMEKKALTSLFDFENREGLFPAVDSRMKFCLITMGNGVKVLAKEATFVFFALNTNELNDPDKRFTLSSEDIALLNPNTRTCPIFRSGRDAELTKAIYRRVPVLIKEARDGNPEENPWGIKFSTMFHMSNDSGLFRTREQLEEEHWKLQGNIFRKAGEKYLPLYEAKMIHHFNHRWATYDGLDTRDFTLEEKQNPNRLVMGRYWVKDSDVQDALKNTGWNKKWLMGYRNIARSNDERTTIESVFPLSGVGHSMPILLSKNKKNIFNELILFQLSLISFVNDFIVRQKLGGINFTFGYFNQIPFLSQSSNLSRLKQYLPKNSSLARNLELTYTAWDLEPFAQDCNYHGPPFKWNEDRRFQIRAELDAAFFHLYLPSTKEGNWKPSLIAEGNVKDETEAELNSLKQGFPTPRHAVEHILESFSIVKRKDVDAYGEYRTKRVILEIYDAMQNAMVTGNPYKSPLDPPAGPPEDSLPEWKPGKPQPEGWLSHIHPPKGCESQEPKTLAELASKEELTLPLILTVEKEKRAKGFDAQFTANAWKGTSPKEGDLILLHHPEMIRNDETAPLGMGTLEMRKTTDPESGADKIQLTLKGLIPPFQVLIDPEDIKKIRPLAALEPYNPE
jgi:hypothetical protein